MTIKREHALSDFIDAWTAGQRPDVDAFVTRVPAAERAALADDIASYLTWAPDPGYDEAALDAIAAEPIVREVLDSATESGGLWPALLPRLRRRASLTRSDLATRLTTTLGLAAGSQAKTERYLDDLEAGTLDTSRLSRRLLEGLADALVVPAQLLENASGPRTSALFRADQPAAASVQADLELLADALSAPPAGDWDEIDALFRGGE